VRRACEREDPGIVAFTLHGRSVKTKSACCPARKSKLAPFASSQNATVSLAILCRSTKVILIFSHGFLLRRNPTWFSFKLMDSSYVDQIPKLYSDHHRENGKPPLFRTPRFHFRNKCGTYQRVYVAIPSTARPTRAQGWFASTPCIW